MIFFYFNVLEWKMQNMLHCNELIIINNVLSIVINIQNKTIFEPVILTVFYTSVIITSKLVI